MLSPEKVTELKDFATDIRLASMRLMGTRGFGHVGGSMSIADIMSVLYGNQMAYKADDPQWEGRDWIVCSKGHAGPAFYAALALKGFYPMDWLDKLNVEGFSLPSHVDRLRTPGIDASAGSLGQGFSMAVGIALAHKLLGLPNRVFAIVGDGESQEGQIWEAISFAAAYKLDNLILFIDDNKQQVDGFTKDINDMECFVDKLNAFKWDVVAVDGHDVCAIDDAIERAKGITGKPSCIVADTVKGQGLPLFAGKACHHIHITPEETKASIDHLLTVKSK